MSGSVSAFSSDLPDVLAEWDAIWSTQKQATRLARKAERDFAEQYGVDKVALAIRTGFGDDLPVGFYWHHSDKPAEWVWWKKGSVIQPRADKRGAAWRDRLSEIASVYPRPRARLKKAFGVPEFVGLGTAPGLARLGDEVWIFFGEKGTAQWDGGEHFRPRRISEYYAALEADEAAT
jgi:hypothetical protein